MWMTEAKLKKKGTIGRFSIRLDKDLLPGFISYVEQSGISCNRAVSQLVRKGLEKHAKSESPIP